MINKNDGGSAFPQSGYEKWAPEGGMTLRDYFAAKALPLALDAMKEGYFHSNEDSLNLDVAVCAYQMADAMLEARNK